MTITILSKVFRRKMNSIPEDLVEHIISFACDRRGYNSIEYHKKVKENDFRMKRIRIELLHWTNVAGYDTGRLSVCWLKPTNRQMVQLKYFKESLKDGDPQVFYHTGCYLNKEQRVYSEGYVKMDRNFDKYVNRNVILTNWNGLTQNVKIVKNDKEKKCLEVEGIPKIQGRHYLTYSNIGKGCAVTKIEFDN